MTSRLNIVLCVTDCGAEISHRSVDSRKTGPNCTSSTGIYDCKFRVVLLLQIMYITIYMHHTVVGISCDVQQIFFQFQVETS